MPQDSRKVHGIVFNANQRPQPGLTVCAFDIDPSAEVQLGSTQTNAQGFYEIIYSSNLLSEQDGADLVVRVYDQAGQVRGESTVLQNAGEEVTVNVIVSEVAETYQVVGKVTSRHSAGVGGLRVRIVDKGVGGDVPLAEAITTEKGTYAVTINAANVRQRGKTQPDLQARVFRDETFLGASAIRYNAAPRETLNVLVHEKAASAMQSEHETLSSSLASHYTGRLGDLQEDDERQDITYLANKSGWDARAVALAALADQFSARTAGVGGGIEPAFFYALFRAGLPANEATLYGIDVKKAEKIWKQAMKKGVIPASLESSLPEVVDRFQKLAAWQALDNPAMFGLSSLKEMTAVSLGDDPARQIQFADIYIRHRKDPPKLWESVRAAFGQALEKRLQLDGKLAYLTLNNAPLISKLHAASGPNGLVDAKNLVDGGYYRSEKWEETIGDDPIPLEIPGASQAEQRAHYAELLAAQVRLSYPTAVVADRVLTGETPLAVSELKNQVHAFLSDQAGKFELGVQPVEQYLQSTPMQVEPEVTREVKRLQRVLQITPGDEEMNILLRNGLDSANAVASYNQEEFVRAFGEEMGGETVARLVHTRSQQVHQAVLNIAVSYLSASSAPAIGVHSPAQIMDPVPQGSAGSTSSVIAYPTLENLFGEMDYCSCEHCRSILSPAAYLVDLLYFCDRPVATGKKPLTELLERRPDIQHLQLTCENTNAPLPYIDLINEILEYYILEDAEADPPKPAFSIQDYQGHSTDDGSMPEDLLANPQFVEESAYATLSKAFFPPPLPFDRSLENLRRYFDRFEAPLAEIMQALRKDDSLEGASESDYGWRDILMEVLRISRAEFRLLTDHTLTLQVLYGYPETVVEADVLATLSNAKAFTRRVGISYEELIEILKTRFINPHATLIPRLERLGLPFATLKALKEGTIPDEDFDAALTPDLDESQYGGNIKAWVRNEQNYANFMSLITLTDPTTPWKADTPYRRGDTVVPTSPPAGSALYYECTEPGQSGSVEPATWPEELGATVPDGDAVWICRNGSGSCSFDKLAFRYADPDLFNEYIRTFEFIQLIRFIRLWKKLGWTIADTDKAITALYPADQFPDDPDDAVNLQRLEAGFKVLLPRLGLLRQVMDTLKLKADGDLLPLLALFAPLDTHGQTSLYRQMFLSRSLLAQDPAFADDGYGGFLTKIEVPYIHPSGALEQAVLDVAPGQIGYNNALQRLYFTGTMSLEVREALKEAGAAHDFQEAVDGLYTAQRLVNHTAALRAAFSLTAEEFSEITAAPNLPSEPPLTLDNVSKIFRQGWLARKLKLSVREFLLLSHFTGIDPFAPPDPPNAPILRFIDLANHLHSAGLKPSQALYLFWNQDLSGKSTPDEREILGFARALRSDFSAIEKEFSLVSDPDGKIARDRMALVYGPESTAFFFSLLDNTFVTEVPYHQDTPNLEPSILDTARGRIAYDDFRGRLSFSGLMNEAVRDALLDLTGLPDAFQIAIGQLFTQSGKITAPFFNRYPELLPLCEAFAFFGELQTIVGYTHGQDSLEPAILAAASGRISYDHVGNKLSCKGVLTTDRRNRLRDVPDVTGSFRDAIEMLFTANQTTIENFFISFPQLASRREAYLAADDAVEARRSVLLASLLPGLKLKRKRQGALQSTGTAAGSDSLLPTALLAEASALHAVGDGARPALDDLIALEEPGLTVRFFFGETVDGEPNLTREVEANVAYSTSGSNPLPSPAPSSPISGIWSGYLEAPENALFNFHIQAEESSTVSLTLSGAPITLVQEGREWSTPEPVDLRAGTLYPFSLTVKQVSDSLFVRWETLGRGREIIPAQLLYSTVKVDNFRQAYLRFLKAVALANAVKLSAAEIGYLASHPSYHIDERGWLNSLPINGSMEDPAALITAMSMLLQFALLKASLSPNDEGLLAVIRDPEVGALNPDGSPGTARLFTLTRWQPDSLDALLRRFGFVESENADRKALKDLDTFHRVYNAYQRVKKVGISAAALVAAATNAPTAETAQNLQAALRARYDESGWLTILKPINDELRELQRDALVAHILHQMRSNPDTAHIDTPEKLFEFFLMDVQMDPCMQTSRIRHALSSVQLFIERCLMNLERHVAPDAIDAKQWEWMKRYRMWEANRKVFLYPENWLEPELRDDQSPFFKEAMSELLQSDITEESAATALINYLSKLDEAAKLEPCGMFHVEGDPNKPEDDVIHVVARTAGANRKYYYRRRESSGWTPWEQIKLDIEDNPVAPVIWRGRLLLFWLRILKQAPLDAPASTTTPRSDDPIAKVSLHDITEHASRNAEANTRMTVQAILCWSEYYNGKWQPTKTSDVNYPATLGQYLPAGSSAFDRSKLRLMAAEEPESRILHIFIGSDRNTSLFRIYNTHSLPVRVPDDQPEDKRQIEAKVEEILRSGGPLRMIFSGSSPITTSYYSRWTTPSPTSPDVIRPMITGDTAARIVEPPWFNLWDTPFLFEDSRHVFYVTTSEQLVNIAEWREYVPIVVSDEENSEIPGLVQEEILKELHGRYIPGAEDQVVKGVGFGVADVSSVESVISEDAYIHRGIGSPGTVRYKGKKIGIRGGVSNGTVPRLEGE